MATGADVMFETAVKAGVDTCFANPGTTEMAMVASLDRVAGVRAVLAQFEGVASGAADGFWRVTGRPAIGMFHLGPGFANSLANVHNARRGRSPIINMIGDQTTDHLSADAPLTSNIELLTEWGGWTRHVASTATAAQDMADAIAAATTGHAGPASLIVPADVTWDEAPQHIPTAPFGAGVTLRDPEVESAAAALREPGAMLILGGAWLTAEMAADIAAIQGATGCAATTYRVPNSAVGMGVHAVPTIPYFPEQAMAALADVRIAVLVGTPEPVTFFGYPDTSSTTLPESARRVQAGDETVDTAGTLTALVAAVGATPVGATGRAPIDVATGTLQPDSLGAAVAASISEGDIVVQEGVTNAAGLGRYSVRGAGHRVVGPTGGAIGGGLPLAVGAAVGAPDARVIAFQADGSSLYTIQSLWTMAREGLDVTIVLCNNQRYAILEVELTRAGITKPGPKAASLTSLADPAIDFVSLAKGFGVPGERVETSEGLTAALARGAAAEGPYLVEAML